MENRLLHLHMNTKTILVVDDEFSILDQALTCLAQAFPDYTLLNASHGGKALDIIQMTPPQLILTDWDMPELNGLQLTRFIKSNEQLKHIPIILMSGKNTSSLDLEQALEAGSIDYLRKPLDEIELKARVKSVLQLTVAQEKIEQQHQQIQDLLQEEKNRLQQELSSKTRKLSSAALLDLEKDKLFTEIQQSFSDISPLLKAHPQHQQKLKQLKNDVKNIIRLESSWDDFKLHFEEVHPMFFKHLENVTEDLSVQETKLAAYLKLGMDNKEIANMLNIAPESARKSVYRLKKKFTIQKSEEENFRTFMLELGN